MKIYQTLLIVTEVYSANGIYTCSGTSNDLNHIKSYSEEIIFFSFHSPPKLLILLVREAFGGYFIFYSSF